MSLNFNLGDIKNHRRKCWIPKAKADEMGWPGFDRNARGAAMHPNTKLLIFQTMAVGIGRITEANVAEFYTRIKLLEKLNGLTDGWWGIEPTATKSEWTHRPIEPKDIEGHIGLETNVPDEPRAEWQRRIIKRDLDSWHYEAKRYMEARHPAKKKGTVTA